MDNLDDSENNAKISDSAYSNSCSNSQSRRSHSSKSTHSGSSGSSGYSGKQSTSGSSNNKLDQSSKKDKESKIKKQTQTDAKVVENIAVVECRPPEPIPHSDAPVVAIHDVIEKTTTAMVLPEIEIEKMEITSSELGSGMIHEMQIATMQSITTSSVETSCQVADIDSAGFSCAISMHDGVVMYTTQNVSTNLGFPKDMWVGRSFIDFVHPKDRNTFASQITNGPAVQKNVHDSQEKDQPAAVSECKIVCRIRRYRSLNLGFGVKDQSISFRPFLLKFFFKDKSEGEGDGKIVFIIQATPIHSSYKTPNERIVDATPFIIRHSAAGILEHIDIDSVPYLGYVPQDIQKKDALMMYHPDDLPYLKRIYETIVKEGSVSKTLPYRMMTQNGDYVKLETEWSSYTNPWSMELEFVIGKHHVVEGPSIPDVFKSPPLEKPKKMTTEEKLKMQLACTHKQCILRIMKGVVIKPAEKLKKQIIKRCLDLAQFVESLLEDKSKPEKELKLEIQEAEPALNYERDSDMLGGISPHHENNDSQSSIGTALSYNQLNYNDNLQRFFDSHKEYCFDKNNSALVLRQTSPKPSTSYYLRSSSPMEFNDFSSSSMSNIIMGPTYNRPPATQGNYRHRLTQSLLAKHNNEMEKQLVKTHRVSRTITRGERPIETRQKKNEHLARCNASYQPTEAGAAAEAKAQGLKRSAMDTEKETCNKHHCSNSRKVRQRRSSAVPYCPLSVSSTPSYFTGNGWVTAPTRTNQTTPYITGLPQPIAMPGMFFYAPSSGPNTGHLLPPPLIIPQPPREPLLHQSLTHRPSSIPHQMHYAKSSMPLVNPKPVYSPYMYPRMFDMKQHQAMVAKVEALNKPLGPLGLPNNNYLQACKSTRQLPPNQPHGLLSSKKRAFQAVRPVTSVYEQLRKGKRPFTALERSTEPVPESSNHGMHMHIRSDPSQSQSGQTSDENMDKTDGESSYSTFYSSFFKTDSGSAEDSSDPKKPIMDFSKKNPVASTSFYSYAQQASKKSPRRKMDPPWMENVCVTPELVNKYQIKLRPAGDVLKDDMVQLKDQPVLVNDQLKQLYLDLELEGVASRLTLEEGITSSSSSDEDGFSAPKSLRRKREYSKMNMIYEADAPLPPPPPRNSKTARAVRQANRM